MVILDTNIIIDHLRSGSSKSALSKLTQTLNLHELALSTISLQELYEGQSTKNKHKEADLFTLITPIQIIDYSSDIAILAGKIARDHAQPIELADAAIAATCLTHDAALATLNQKHLSLIKNLTLYPVKTKSPTT